jgi:hypothetical protein
MGRARLPRVARWCKSYPDSKDASGHPVRKTNVNDTNDHKPAAPVDPERVDTSPVNPPPPEDEASVVWLVSYSDDDDRELRPSQIAEALRRGEIDGETIVWREGAEDWVPLADVPSLAKLLSSSGETAAAPLVAPNAALLRRASAPPLPDRTAVKPKTPSVRPAIAGRTVPTAKGTTKLGMPKLEPKKDPVQQLAPKQQAAPGAIPDMTPTVPRSPAAPTGSRAGSKAGIFAPTGDDEDAPISIEPEFMRPPSPAPARAMQRAKALSPGTLGMKKPAPPPRPPMKSTPDPEPLKQEPPVQATPQRVKKAPPAPPFKSRPEPAKPAPEPTLTPDPGTPSLGTLAAPVRDEPKPAQQKTAEPEPAEPRPAEPKQAAGALLGAEELLTRAIALDPTETADPNAAPPVDTSKPVVAAAASAAKKEASDEARSAPTKSDAATATPVATAAAEASDAPVSEARPSAPAKPGGKNSLPIYVAVGAVAIIAVFFARGNPDSGTPRGNPETPAAAPPRAVEPATAAPDEPTPVAPAATQAPAPATPPETAAAEPPRAPANDVAPATPAARATGATTAALKAEAPKPAAVAPQPAAAPAPKAEAKPAESKPAPAAPEQKEVAIGGEFDKAAAGAALAGAAQEASGCRKEGDPSGVAVVHVTFSNAGRATRAVIEGPPFAGTQTGGCIASTLRRATVPPYGGERVTVTKKVVIR